MYPPGVSPGPSHQGRLLQWSSCGLPLCLHEPVWWSGRVLLHQRCPKQGIWCCGCGLSASGESFPCYAEAILQRVSLSLPCASSLLMSPNGVSQPSPCLSYSPQVHEVHVTGNALSPDPVTINVNDVVAWTFRGLRQSDVQGIQSVDQVLDLQHTNAFVAPRWAWLDTL